MNKINIIALILIMVSCSNKPRVPHKKSYEVSSNFLSLMINDKIDEAWSLTSNYLRADIDKNTLKEHSTAIKQNGYTSTDSFEPASYKSGALNFSTDYFMYTYCLKREDHEAPNHKFTVSCISFDKKTFLVDAYKLEVDGKVIFRTDLEMEKWSDKPYINKIFKN